MTSPNFPPPEHISFSQYHTYTECPRSWYLSKIRRAEERPTWYLAIGKAVHEMVEDNLSGEMAESLKTAEDYFYPIIRQQMLIEPDTSLWMAGGPVTDPIVDEKALQKVKDCFERALEFLDDWDVWEVEYDASGRLPGLEVEVKAFVDIIGEYKGPKKKYHGPGILDWKSGSKKPGNNFQLETYQALLISGDPEFMGLAWRGGVINGWWAMLDPNASEARPIGLSAVDPAEVGAKYQKVYDGMKSMQVEAKKKFMCKMCFHQDNCIPYAGLTKRSIYYDRSHLDQPPY